jgi:hypothetical protein
VPLGCLARFYLCFYVFAFPSSCHANILTQFGAVAGDYERETWRMDSAAAQGGEAKPTLFTCAIDDFSGAQGVLNGSQRANVP